MSEYGTSNIPVAKETKEVKEVNDKLEALFRSTEILAANMGTLMERLAPIVAQNPEKDENSPATPTICTMGAMLQDVIIRISNCNKQLGYLFRNLQI